MTNDIRRIVDPGRPLPTFAEAMAMTEAAKLQMVDLRARLDKLEARPPAPPPAPLAGTARAAAPAKPSVDDISRVLAAMDPEERALLVTRCALAVPAGGGLTR